MPTSNLTRYWTKRDFKTTPEPRGKRKAAGGALRFVVQKHAARRLHYDFRLELDGTLKSWAVPKGPSLDPHDKRMAVHVEDHPLDYADFEGVIPEKQYGAGTVIVWDRGVWEPIGDPEAGYAEGKLKFELRGTKLHGRWTLVRMHGHEDDRQEPWLLIKENDDDARPASGYSVTEAQPDSVLGGKEDPEPEVKAAPAKKRLSAARTSGAGRKKLTAAPPAARTQTAGALPVAFSPQLATLVDGPPTAGTWEYEIKFDGYRILTRIDGADIRLFTRNGNDWTAKLRSLAQAIAALKLPSGWLDGEIVVADAQGRSDFQALQKAFDTAQVDDVQYYVFDLPYYNGDDLRRTPLTARRDLLRGLLLAEPSNRIRFSESFEASAQDLLGMACRLGLEGIIAKDVTSPYVSARARSWLKLKCTQRQEFVIGGFTAPKGARTGLGALLLGVYDERGRLQYAGNVGTGFDAPTLTSLHRQLSALVTTDSPFHQAPKEARGTFVKPKLVAEISFAQWTQDHRLRHAVFHGLRADKSAPSVHREQATHMDRSAAHQAPAPVAKARSRAKRSKATPASADAAGDVQSLEGVTISHGARVIDSASGATKLDLVRYYDAVAPYLLPHLKGRPVSLVRAPRGVSGQLFFQKHADTLRVPGITELPQSLWTAHPPLLEITTAQAIVSAAQLNTIELHTWNATKKAIELPDRMIFDLDPGEGVSWKHVTEAALLTQTLLDEMGLIAFLKTSGGKGLHVVVPLAPRYDWDTVKELSQAVVTHLARSIPERFVAKSGPKNRVGKIFVDYLRNGRGATTATAFSARARPGLGVSMPIFWEELKELKSGSQWDISNTMQRMQQQKLDPWAAYAKSRQSLTQILKQFK